jgi:poly(hydroxyalkanoate) granule-associated protein
MTDKKKKTTPSINVTRGRKQPARSGAKKASDAKQKSSGSWTDVPAGLAEGARDVWLAGLGALSVVEDQGTKLFRALVQEGKSWEKTRREEAEAALKEAEKESEETVEAAQEAMDEQVVRRVREGVDAALDRAGVPTRTAMDDLRQQIDDLAIKADRLAAQLDKQGDGAPQ